MFPGIWSLNGVGFLLSFYASRMSAFNKLSLAAAVGLHLAFTWFGGHHPRSRSVFILDLLNWTVTTAFAGARLAVIFGKLSARITAESEQQTANHARDQRMAGWTHQHREAELLHDLARQTMDQAQLETQRHRDKIRRAREEHDRLADDLSRAHTILS